MIKGIESITLSSENAKNLADFYKDKVGLDRTIEAEIGDNGKNLFGFEITGSPTLYIMDQNQTQLKLKR